MDEQRASDADRERAAEHLQRAGGEGRLDVEELGERVELAFAARTRADLERLLADVEQDRAPALRDAGPGAGVAVRPGPGGERWVLSVMGGARRTGRWRVAERATVLNVMGGSDVDLTRPSSPPGTPRSPSSR